MTAAANGLHQRCAAGEQKECNGGMTQRKKTGRRYSPPRKDDMDRSAISRKFSTYHVVSGTLLQVLAAVQT